MITVVSDTSPINYLCRIGALEVLPKLFHEVLIPPAVAAELSHPHAPAPVAKWIANLPTWASIKAPTALSADLRLDRGETEAISLALELNIPAILIDERAGWLVAQQRGVTPLGTLNILFSADAHGFLDFEESIERLRRTNFHMDSVLVETLLAEARRRTNI